MKRLLFIFACFCAFTTMAQTTTVRMNNEKWSRVEELERQSLPQSALEIVNQIQEDAIKEGNSPELIKTLIYQLKYETAIDQDQLPDKIIDLEQWILQSENNPTGQAVLYSIAAELYANYYNANAYRMNQRTAIAAYEPEDIREWTANHFIRKIAGYVHLSLLPAGELQKTDALVYRAILEEGESSRTLRPTLYDFLAQRGIELLKPLVDNNRLQNYFPQTRLSNRENFAPVEVFVQHSFPVDEYDFVSQILKIYQDLLNFRMQENNPLALLLTDLDRLEFVHRNTQLENTDNYYLDALQLLEEKYANNDFCVEILYNKASFIYSRRMNGINAFAHGEDTSPEDSVLIKESLRQIDAICTEGIKKYPQYERIGILQHLLFEVITKKDLTAGADNVVYPGKSLEINLRYRNINKLFIQLYKIDAPVLFFANWSDAGQYKNNGKLILSKEIDLANDFPYLFSDTVIKIPVRELGSYEYVIYADSISTKDTPVNKQFSVSRLASVARNIDGQREFLITDRLSGQPIEGATVRFYRRKYDSSSISFELIEGITAVTNRLGLAACSGDNNLFYNVSFRNDTSLILSPVPWLYTSIRPDRASSALRLFTDRSIYRPGQTVYFKGIAFETEKTETKAITGKRYTITLRDANYKEVANQTVTTNDFGSFAGEFQLPHGLLTGYFTLRSDVDNANLAFRVEEYKRPTFDIRFAENDNAYRLGEQATIEGNAKTFSGISITNNELRYRITRQNHWLFRWAWREPVQVAEGTVQTDDDGNFKIAFIPERAFEDRNRNDVYYTYTVEVSLTDAAGETQQSQTQVNIGETAAYLDTERLGGTVIDKETFSGFTIRAFNLNRRPVQTTGTYEIYSLTPKNPSQLDAPSGEWILNRRIASGEFEAGKEIDLSSLRSFASGRYRLIANAENTKETQTDFTLASAKDRRPPIAVYEWLMTPKTTCAVGESAEIVYGTSARNVHVLYEIFLQNGKRLSASRFVLNNQNRQMTIPFLESYGEGITVHFTFIKDNRVFNKRVEIYKKQPDSRLDLKMEVFRDRLLPGQKEEWKISIKDAEKNPVLAELLTVMYDASLDKIQNHSWGFSPRPRRFLSSTYPINGKEFERTFAALETGMVYILFPEFSFDNLNWFGWNIYSGVLAGRGRPMLMRSVVASEDASMLDEVITVGFATQQSSNITESETVQETASQSEIQIRQNFNETAFFYPQLKTNEAGETLISFTVPESNTTWKLMGLAHTKDMKFGQLIETVISQKQLMVRPNLPRFLREGDSATIASNISNLSEKTIEGTVQLEFFDPVTGQTNIVVPDNIHPFRLEAGKTTAVSWTLKVPSGIDLTALKIVARSPEFSDGEQHLIPVLPNRMLVTESLPMTIQGGQTKTFTFDALNKTNSPTKENYRLTLEFTSNPVWYAIQALPALSVPESDNVLSWFAAYYSNVTAAHIANSTPKIKSIIDVWTAQGGTKETLLSQLEKNQELKTVLLEETPWVMEAQNETEQRQRLSLLFDINRNNYLNMQAIEKLRSLQTEEGGWTWFKGMPASVSITQWILYGMGELSRLDVEEYTNETQQMQMQAIRFIDNRFKRHYDDYRKREMQGSLSRSVSTYELEYLLVRSMYKDIPLNETNEAFQFFLELTGRHWASTSNLYDRAIAALVLHRNGNAGTARSIVRSLREHAANRPDEGMFWVNNRAQSFLFLNAVCVHTFMMEAFHETGSTPEEMDRMKLWLLKQKQTQQWGSAPATVNAVNILLKTGSNWLESEGKLSIRIGNHTVDTQTGDAGTGYIRTVFDANAITPDMNRITVSKESAGPGWGAVYGQYFEDLDKIAAARTGLHIEKSLFVENNSPAGRTLLPVAANQSLKVGDKAIVRLVVRTDRDLEYVHLRDLRASCFEPAETLSGIRWTQQAIYYYSVRDASVNYFFYNLPRGTYVFEYPLYVNAPGDYSNGIATIQCLYAPEFVSHTSGGRVKVE